MAGMQKGPPSWDYSKKANLKIRMKRQATIGQNAMYSSDYYSFRSNFLNGNSAINRHLKRLANRALFALRREIPLGDARGGHLRNQLAVLKRPRGGFYNDRDTYVVTVPGGTANPAYRKFSFLNRRSSFASEEEWKSALREAQGGLTGYGSASSWIERAARHVNERG